MKFSNYKEYVKYAEEHGCIVRSLFDPKNPVGSGGLKDI